MKNLKTTIVTMKTIKHLMFALLVAFTFSCEGEDGEDGIDGIAGQDGENGNANVTSVSVPSYDVIIGGNIFDIPGLSQDIVDTGVVLAYTTVNGNAFWETLPVVTGGSVILDIDRILLEQLVVTSTFNQTLDFRFILIESSTSIDGSVRSSAQNPRQQILDELNYAGVNINNYDEVAAYYNLDR